MVADGSWGISWTAYLKRRYVITTGNEETLSDLVTWLYPGAVLGVVMERRRNRVGSTDWRRRTPRR